MGHRGVDTRQVHGHPGRLDLRGRARKVLEAPCRPPRNSRPWLEPRGPRPGRPPRLRGFSAGRSLAQSRGVTRRRDCARDQNTISRNCGSGQGQPEGAPFWVKADEGGRNGLRSRLRSRVLCGPAAESLAGLLGLDVWGGPLSLRPVGAVDLLGPARAKLAQGGSAPKPLYLKPARFEKPK